MSLVAATYFIFSGPRQVGRPPREDRSLLPKRVLALPPGVEPLGPWRVEPTAPGRYRLLAQGAPTAEDKGLLFAFLVPGEDRDFEWVITARGNNNYTIEKPGGYVGWSAGEDDSQIAVTPFIPGGPDRLFKFIPVDQE